MFASLPARFPIATSEQFHLATRLSIRHSRAWRVEDARERAYVPAIHVLLAERKTWMPAQASLRSLRKLGCMRGHDAAAAPS
jgi:hypothetical protein